MQKIFTYAAPFTNAFMSKGGVYSYVERKYLLEARKYKLVFLGEVNLMDYDAWRNNGYFLINIQSKNIQLESLGDVYFLIDKS